MKTKHDVIVEVVKAQVFEAMKRDVEKQKGYGSRIARAGEIVTSDGVKALGNSEYEVASGTTAGLTYIVNGACKCPDAVKGSEGKKGGAPQGFCKHRMAVVIWKHTQAHLKELVEKLVPHTWHRWDCEAHREVPITCWQRACPDSIETPCPTCGPRVETVEDEGEVFAPVAVAGSDTPAVDATTGEIIEDAEVPYPVIASASTGDTSETPFPEEDDTVMSTLGETVTQVIERLRGSRNGNAPEPVVIDTTPEVEAEPAPLIYKPEQYEPAPVIQAEEIVPFLPEAPVSCCFTIKLPDNNQLTYTLRGHTDAEVLARIPIVLAGLEKAITPEANRLSWLRRIFTATFPPRDHEDASGK